MPAAPNSYQYDESLDTSCAVQNRLTQLDLPAVGNEHLKWMVRSPDIDVASFKRALRAADHDENAMVYVRTALTKSLDGVASEQPRPQHSTETGQGARPRPMAPPPPQDRDSVVHLDPRLQQPRSNSRQAPAPPAPPQRSQPKQTSAAPVRQKQRTQDPSAASTSSRVDGRTSINDDQPRFEPSFHVYGSSASFEFKAGTNRGRRAAVVFIDAAAAEGQGVPRKYDWSNKICLMLTPDEILECLAVVFGMMPSVSFKNHGPQKNKMFELAHQGRHLFAKLVQFNNDDRNSGGQSSSAKATNMVVQIGPADATRLGGLLLRQARKELYGATGSDVLTLVNGVVAKMKNAAPNR